jgi:molybdenum cofactor guanylyltransferase
MSTHLVPSHESLTLGILAGGLGSRLGGRDKAWLVRDGEPLVAILAQRMSAHVDAVLVSANRNPEHYLSHGLRALHDRVAGIGPLGGLDALATACRTPWLLTLPVDMLQVPDNLVESLTHGDVGAFAVDDDGAQPLVAAWRTDGLRLACEEAIRAGEHAVHALQAAMAMMPVRFEGLRFGNLNTPADLAAAGIELP